MSRKGVQIEKEKECELIRGVRRRSASTEGVRVQKECEKRRSARR